MAHRIRHCHLWAALFCNLADGPLCHGRDEVVRVVWQTEEEMTFAVEADEHATGIYPLAAGAAKDGSAPALTLGPLHKLLMGLVGRCRREGLCRAIGGSDGTFTVSVAQDASNQTRPPPVLLGCTIRSKAKRGTGTWTETFPCATNMQLRATCLVISSERMEMMMS